MQGGLSQACITSMPAGMGPPPHTHPGAESVYVLEGRIRYHIGDQTIEAGPGSGGTVFVQSGGGRNVTDPPVPPQVVMAIEHYGRIWRLLQKKIPVRLK